MCVITLCLFQAYFQWYTYINISIVHIVYWRACIFTRTCTHNEMVFIATDSYRYIYWCFLLGHDDFLVTGMTTQSTIFHTQLLSKLSSE